MTDEPEVTRLPMGESRQHDPKGDPILPGFKRRPPRGKTGRFQIRFGVNGPEEEIYVRRDD